MAELYIKLATSNHLQFMCHSAYVACVSRRYASLLDICMELLMCLVETQKINNQQPLYLLVLTAHKSVHTCAQLHYTTQQLSSLLSS